MTKTTVDRIRAALERDLRDAETALRGCQTASSRSFERRPECLREQTAAASALADFIAEHGVGQPKGEG